MGKDARYGWLVVAGALVWLGVIPGRSAGQT
jgi:hypothetical protein